MTNPDQIISQTAEDITRNITAELTETHSIRLKDLAANIPDFLKSQLEVTIDKNLVETFLLPDSEWADTDRESVRQAWGHLLFELRKEYCFPARKASPVIRSAVEAVLNLLVRPRKAVPETLFDGDERVDREELNERAKNVFVHKHLVMAPVRYLYRKNLNDLTVEQCRRIITQVDEKLMSRYDTRNWLELLDPLFRLAGDSIDPRLLSLYFRDKMRPRAARRFDQLHTEVTRDLLMKILSAVDIQDPGAAPEIQNETQHSRENGDSRRAGKPVFGANSPEPGDSSSAADLPHEVPPASSSADETGTSMDGDIHNAWNPQPKEAERGEDEDDEIPLHKRFMSDSPESDDPESDDTTTGFWKLDDPEEEFPERSSWSLDEPEMSSSEKPDLNLEKTENSSEYSDWNREKPAMDLSERSAMNQNGPETGSSEKPGADQEKPENSSKKADWNLDDPQSVSEEREHPIQDSDDQESGFPNFLRNYSGFEGEKTFELDSASAEISDGDENSSDEGIWQNFIRKDSDGEQTDDRHEEVETLAGDFLQREEDRAEELMEWLSDDEARIVKDIFKGSEKGFKRAVTDLAEEENWKSAARYIKVNIFSRYRVDMYEDTAVDFTDKMHAWFIENKSR